MKSLTKDRSLMLQTVVTCTLIFTCLHNCVLEQPTATANDDDLSPQHVLETLRENASLLTPISLDYTHEHIPGRDPEETLAELDIRRNDPREFLNKSEHNVLWGDGRVYVSSTRPLVDDGVLSIHVWEESYTDGVHYSGRRVGQDPILFKQPASRITNGPPNTSVINLLYLRSCGYDPVLWSDESAERLELHSWIPFTIDSGGTLEGIHREDSGEHSGLFRVDIIGPNPVRELADSIDLEAEKQALKSSLETPERQAELIKRVEEWKSAPPTRNYTFWLDPDMRFAIRASEIRNNHGQLLVESRCEDFEHLPERNVWLPRLCTVRHFSYDTVPGRLFQDPILIEEARVSSIDLSPIEASRFVLNHTEPGTVINDGTASGAANEPGGYLRTVIGEKEKEVDPLRVDDVNPPKASTWRWFVSVNILGLIVLVGFLGWRHIRHA
ncbi:MAG: hypothetical protein KDA93_26720 [Planctomycetaceae bacterium]|nr:hypothetical protein [Planctomycetaceae bacterium]